MIGGPLYSFCSLPVALGLELRGKLLINNTFVQDTRIDLKESTKFCTALDESLVLSDTINGKQ